MFKRTAVPAAGVKLTHMTPTHDELALNFRRKMYKRTVVPAAGETGEAEQCPENKQKSKGVY